MPSRFEFVFLQIGFPQAVEIAVSIHGYGLIIAQKEADRGGLTGLEAGALAAVFSLQIYPLDEVLIQHGMVDAADIYGNLAVFNGGYGNMLLAAGLNGVGLQSGHLLAAAHEGYACIVDHAHQIAAVLTDIKLCHIYFLLLYGMWCVVY